MISLVVTTWGQDTLYTRRCLDSILSWKSHRDELIVVVHDESVLLGAYLRAEYEDHRINTLIYAESGNGHVRGVNLGFAAASGDYIFNINTDVRVGPGLVDDCVAMFTQNPRLGLVGWHYNWSPDHEGTFWRGERHLSSTLRLRENLSRRPGYVDREHMRNIQRAPWASGRVIGAVGDRRILCANTSFFGVPNQLWHRIGGFDDALYPDSWADDFLCYAVLEHGFDIANLGEDVRISSRPARFASLSDLAWTEAGEPDRGRDLLFPGDGDKARQLTAVIERRIEQGARVLAHGNYEFIPDDLLRRCHRSAPDPDFMLIGGHVTLPDGVGRLAPGGAAIRYTRGAIDSRPAIATRTCYRRRALRPPAVSIAG